jgi:hypothetical protein
MMRKLYVLTVFIVLVELMGCPYESRQTTLREPGVYKGTKDQLLARQQEQILIDRFKLVQTDRD